MLISLKAVQNETLLHAFDGTPAVSICTQNTGPLQLVIIVFYLYLVGRKLTYPVNKLHHCEW